MQSVTKSKPLQSHVQQRLLKSARHVSNVHSVQILVQRSLLKSAKFANQHHVQSEQNVQRLVQNLRRRTRRQNVQNVQHLRKSLTLVQQHVATRRRQRLHAPMMVVQTLNHASVKSLIRPVQRKAVLHLIHVQLTSVPSVQYVIAAMKHLRMLVMISRSMQNLILMQRWILVQMTTTFQQTLQMQT